MSFLQTIRDDVNKLANHTLDLGKFTVQIEAKVASEMEAFKAEVMSRVDKMLSDLKSEIIGGVEAQASKAVAALGTEVASMTGGAGASGASPTSGILPGQVVTVTLGAGQASGGTTSVHDLVAADVPEAAPAHITAAVTAHDNAVASGSTSDVAHADAVAAAAQAGAEPDMAARIADSVTINPPSAAAAL